MAMKICNDILKLEKPIANFGLKNKKAFKITFSNIIENPTT